MKYGKSYMHSYEEGIRREWVITNGLGGYAGNTIIDTPARKNHGLLVASFNPPVNRYMILSSICESIVLNGNVTKLSDYRYTTDTTSDYSLLHSFEYEFVPTYTYMYSGMIVKKTIALDYGNNTVAILYTIKNGQHPCTMTLTPAFTYRDHCGLSREEELLFNTHTNDHTITLVDTDSSTKINLYCSEGTIREASEKYINNICYDIENSCGNTYIDSVYTPHTIDINLIPYEEKSISVICSTCDTYPLDASRVISDYIDRKRSLIKTAGYNDIDINRLVTAADSFIAEKKSTGNKTILAGLPWFTDWGRDTMISFTGLLLYTRRYEEAKQILLTFAKYTKNGLVPNMFPDDGSSPLYNTADASLWYFIAIHNYVSFTKDYEFVKNNLYTILKDIIDNYKNGTDYSIKMCEDGLISAGSDLDQVTWMDVRVDELVVTKRHGKPVEINALWYNALNIIRNLAALYGDSTNEYDNLISLVEKSYEKVFWNDKDNCLYDVVNDELSDNSIRPNQIYAVSLPYSIISKDKERAVVNTVYEKLYAYTGLRTLSRDHMDYHPYYRGKLMDRDLAYHQGTSWAYLMGGFISAYIKVNDYSDKAYKTAEELLNPLLDHMNEGCIDHISEVFDGDYPNMCGGCYAQAWSVGELLRVLVDIRCHK